MATEAPGLQDRFVAYEQHCFDESALSTGEKYVIALACAHTLQSPYGIDDFTRRALEHGATLDALTEAIHVAVAIRGGASLIHGLQMMEHANDFAKRESA
ncbi:MAG: carboxymuconolactone decarboxylase family protein [Myxococcota bacterium]